MLVTNNSGITYDDQTGEVYRFDGHTGFQKTGQKVGQEAQGYNSVTRSGSVQNTAQPGQASPVSSQQPGTADFIFNVGDNPRAKLFNKTYGDKPTEYSGVFDSAYQNLGQKGGNNSITANGTYALADAFADRFFQKTGALPSEDQLRQFVAQNLNSGFAQKFIQGIPRDQITAMADDYFVGNPDVLVAPGAKSAEEQRLGGLKEQLDKIYQTGEQNYISNYDQNVYGPAKTTAVNDLAGQGMLTNPNSRYTLNQIEGNRGRDISSGINTLESNRAAGQVDLGKTIEDLLQKNKDRAQSGYQFNKTFSAGREDTAFNQGLQRQQLTMADQLGRLQAENNKKGWADYLTTALGAAGTAANAYSGITGANALKKLAV